MLQMTNDEEEEEYDEPINNSISIVTTKENPPNVSFPVSDDDEEEENELLPDKFGIVDGETRVIDAKSLEKLVSAGLCSAEFVESQDAIASDCWDISSWIVFIEEVENRRAGNLISITDAYTKILTQFPRSAMLWRKLAEHLVKEGDVQSALEAFEKCVNECRNVELWRSYISLVKSTTVGQANVRLQTTYAPQQVKFEAAFEQALASVGSALDAASLWQDYLGAVRDSPVFDAVLDAGKKLAKLRALSQRAVVVPMDGVEALWAEYELFERSNSSASGVSLIGGESVDALLAELNKRHLHARSVCRERRRMCVNIEFDRLACPPTQSTSEMQQLELWNGWIKFELSNPDNLDAAALHDYLRMLYDQCLCCFRFNAEVWLSLARLEQRRGGADEARKVISQAIEGNPGVSLLRAALAELEEESGDLTAAETVLRDAFETAPCGFTFSLLQRFVRRQHGKTVARRVFSATLGLRSADAQLGYEVLMAHARMEEEVNCDLSAARSALGLARQKYATCSKDVFFIRAFVRLLLKTGDIQQVRWLCETALGELAIDRATASAAAADKPAAASKSYKRSSVSSSSLDTARAEWDILSELLHAETVAGACGVTKLNELRARRREARLLLIELERARSSALGSTRDRDGPVSSVASMFEPAYELAERYDLNYNRTVVLPGSDADLRDRSRRLLGHQHQQWDTRTATSQSQQGAKARNTAAGGAGAGAGGEMVNMSAEFHLSLAGLPVLLRDLLAKLPLHNGPPPDIDAFVRHVRGITLPPRPTVEEEPEQVAGGAQIGEDGQPVPHWLEGSAAMTDEAEATEAERGRASADEAPDEDLFRKRQRTKLVA